MGRTRSVVPVCGFQLWLLRVIGAETITGKNQCVLPKKVEAAGR
jgi:hypothetical protein